MATYTAVHDSTSQIPTALPPLTALDALCDPMLIKAAAAALCERRLCRSVPSSGWPCLTTHSPPEKLRAQSLPLHHSEAVHTDWQLGAHRAWYWEWYWA